jgi:hypothetical protein
MTQSNYLWEKQSGLNLQKDKRVCISSSYGLYMSVAVALRGMYARSQRNRANIERSLSAIEHRLGVLYTKTTQSGSIVLEMHIWTWHKQRIATVLTKPRQSSVVAYQTRRLSPNNQKSRIDLKAERRQIESPSRPVALPNWQSCRTEQERRCILSPSVHQNLNICQRRSHTLYWTVRQVCSFYSSTWRGSNQHPSNINMQVTSSHSQPNYRGPVELSSYEIKWRDRQPLLESKGYMLRPRLRPGWTPSWLSTGQEYFSCEDSARLPVS